MRKLSYKLFLPLLLVLITLILTTKGIDSGEFWWSDESRHAMDGVFILDFMKDLPFDDVYGYAERYYAKYPALGFTWYLPGFAFIESLFFAVLGISEVSARLTVTFFAVMAVFLWYVFVSKISDETIAFFSSILFITNIEVVIWSRDVMLELPAISFTIMSCYFFYNYFVLEKQRHVYYLTFSIILGLYIKQTILFILPVFFCFLLVQKQLKKLLTKPVILCAIIFIIGILPIVIFTIVFGKVGLSASFGDLHELRGGGPRSSIDHWTAYIKLLPQTFTWPFLVLVVFSIASFLIQVIKKRNYDKIFFFFMLWFFWWYFSFSILGGAESRYSTYLAPAMAVLAVWPIKFFKSDIVRLAFISLIGFFSIYQIVMALGQPRNFVRGYEEAAKYVMDNPKGTTVLFSGFYDGNFIFNVRKYDPQRQAIILRADKILTTMSVFKEWGYSELVNSAEDIYHLLDKYGTKYIVVENRDLIGAKPFQMLLEIVSSDDFNLVKTINVDTNLRHLSDLSINIYEYKKDTSVLSDSLVIKFPLLGREIKVPLESLAKKPPF